MDYKTVNELNAEDRAYAQWVRAKENRILAMSNPQRKREEWRKLHPKRDHSDDWLLDGKVF